jgi:hypothetical protein
MVERKLPKLETGVRFPSPAPVASRRALIAALPLVAFTAVQVGFVATVDAHRGIAAELAGAPRNEKRRGTKTRGDGSAPGLVVR